MFKYYGNIHVNFTGVGANVPLESNLMFRIIDIQFYCLFPARVSLQFKQFSPFQCICDLS